MKIIFYSALVLLLIAPRLLAADREDILLSDFEGDTWGEWKTTGEAFGPGPAKGTLPNQMPVTGFLGKGLANSFHGGDKSVGTLTSPPFKIERKFINFLIGGGKYPGETCMNLLIDGKVVRTATGPNDKPGGSEQLDWANWNVEEFEGKTATIQMVDKRTEGWGHLCVDHIVQSDKKRQSETAQRELAITQHYLHLPVKTGAAKVRVKFVVEDATVREFDIELAEGEPSFWAFCDVSAYKGKKLRIEAGKSSAGQKALDAVEQSDDLKNADDLYKEKLRPQLHFSSRRGWLNDPNGLVFSNGEYHLFYQHNPYGWDWGNMHWGHAVSKDLVHWKELPVALYPKKYGDWCFSGSAVVDKGNTAGFKKGKEDVLVAIYTSTGRGECIAFSNDDGRTFTDYEANPVVKHHGRDPKVFWHEASNQWVMAVYDEKGDSRGVAFHTSPDLKKWEFRSRVDGFYECPELFELPVDGDKKKTRWVLTAANNEYVLGTFDGKEFKAETKKLRGNQGDCLYAAQTFNNIPSDDGRRLQIGWAQVATPGLSFNQAMTFPTELTLRTTDDGVRLFANPAREIEKLHGKKHAWKDLTLKEGDNPLKDLRGELFHIRAEFEVQDTTRFGFSIRGIPIEYDAKGKSPFQPANGKLRLEILVDRGLYEIFANDGAVYIPRRANPKGDDQTLSVFAKGGAVKLTYLEVYELNSAWK